MVGGIKISRRLYLEVKGIKIPQADELLKDLRTIEGIDEVKHYLQESIEFKEICAPIVVYITESIAVGVIANLISEKIKKFFDKEKSIDKEPIVIQIQNININQGESKQQIENKINMILNSK